jgi:hypothetical protein
MYITLNISNTGIRLLGMAGKRVAAWGETKLAAGMVKDGLILQPAAVGESIGVLCRENKIPNGTKVIACLTGMSFTYRFFTLPKMKPSLEEEAVFRAAKKEIPLPMDELYVAWQAVATRPNERDYFVTGVARNIVDALCLTLESASLEPYILDLKSLALARAIGRGDSLILSLEPDYFDIVLVTKGLPVIQHTVSPRWEGGTPEDNGRQLIDELLKIIGFYNSGHPRQPFRTDAPLLLTGTLSTIPEIEQLIRSEVEYPVEPLKPSLPYPEGLPVAAYAANLGLVAGRAAKKDSVFHDVSVNILSGKYRKPKTHPVSAGKIMAALIMIAGVALLFPLYQVYTQSKTESVSLLYRFGNIDQSIYQAEWAIKVSEQTEAAILDTSSNITSIENEHKTMLVQRGKFTSDLKLVTDALPASTHFTSIDMGGKYITLHGRAKNKYDVIACAVALGSKGRFSEVRIVEVNEVDTVPVNEAGTSVSGSADFPIVFDLTMSKPPG